MRKNCVVIGGGIIGLCTAYYLLKEGHKVTVLEKGNMAGGASYVNAGYITPSHFIPLSSPGIITKGLKWMLNSQSPFYVKPRLERNFLNWAWAFKKSATSFKVQQVIPVLKDINLFSRALYEEMRESGDFSFSYARKGLLMCYKTEHGEREEHEVAEIAKKEGMGIRHYSTAELVKEFPKANYNVTGAFYYDTDAHMTPDDFMLQLREFLERAGVEIHQNCEVKAFEENGEMIQKVTTSNGSFEVEELILAAGTWTPFLAKKLNISVSIEAGKGYSFDIKRPTGIEIPSILTEAKVAVTPMDGFTRFAGTMELGGINNQVNPNRVDAIALAAENYFDQLQISSEERNSARSGLRPCSPDGLPYIGRPKKWKNLIINSGHAMMGWSLGPASGKLVSQIIDKKSTSLDTASFNPDRKF
ncbi:MAG: FAD-dependent oxidoreductase [Christiangramia sp.]|uniref:NAD(P)/FAD-dependent oxidoreductase n=1 Tax=Christiangramia sp. TaxID=1931228 RepID=UPI00324287AE